ncbi:hypothetical protein EEK96_19960, partial [Escherichia coli]|nr:hypothetical protein [Escherichia coli]
LSMAPCKAKPAGRKETDVQITSWPGTTVPKERPDIRMQLTPVIQMKNNLHNGRCPYTDKAFTPHPAICAAGCDAPASCQAYNLKLI